MRLDLQQTPVTSPKASIKLVVQDPSPQAGSHTLTFTSATARDDQQTITGLLRKWIEAFKSQSAATPVPTAVAGSGGGSGGSGASSTLAMARTVTAAAPDDGEEAYDDAKLLADLGLQMSLLNSSPALRQRFDRALQEKPESVSIAQFLEPILVHPCPYAALARNRKVPDDRNVQCAFRHQI